MATHHEIWKKHAGTKTAEVGQDPEDLLLSAPQSENNPQDMLHAIQSTDKPSPRSVLMLQRTYGNRATARLLTPDRTHSNATPTPTLQPRADSSYLIRRETVAKEQKELAPSGDIAYGWNYQYSVRFTPTRCILTIKVKMTAAPHPDTGDIASDKDMATVREQSASQFAKIWDNEFLLVETGTNQKYSLRAELQFVDSGEDVSVELYKGPGRDDLSHWYTDTDDGVSRAHELGHQMGLLDEYEDPGVENRKDSTASGVHTDHSVMGNYEDEGFAPAEAKLRHGQHFAKDISEATGRSFSAIKPSRIEMFFRKLWS
ncbi:MAG: hypothetical protein U0452_02925 [Anaerolineae bacterium]